MSSSLHFYLIQLAEERNIDCKNLKIEVDNACSRRRMEVGHISSSSFYSDDSSSRWTESSSSLDYTLRIPQRSLDFQDDSEYDQSPVISTEPCLQGQLETDDLSFPQRSLDFQDDSKNDQPPSISTKPCLQEQPETDDRSPRAQASSLISHAEKNLDDEDGDCDDIPEKMPLLSGCRYGKDEKHPTAALVALKELGK
eukprot:scaffold584_cov132-Cylindrotheca_fusiformis.AAC.27